MGSKLLSQMRRSPDLTNIASDLQQQGSMCPW